MNQLLKVVMAFGVVFGFSFHARGVQPAVIVPPAQAKVMSEFKGVKLGMKREAVKAAMGTPESSSDASDDFKLKGDDTMTVHYDNGEVRAIQLAFLDSKNAPAWNDVVGDAPVSEVSSGKTARKTMEAEKYWVTIYQNKEGTVTRITISR
jgi:hypothetical protein